MSHHPGMPVEQSGSDEFYSDANLMKRAQPASYNDFAPLPGENMNVALSEAAEGGSPALRSYAASGGALTPLPLAEVEVDEGGRSADSAINVFRDSGPPTPHAPAAPDDSSLDRLADLLLARIEKKLGGA